MMLKIRGDTLSSTRKEKTVSARIVCVFAMSLVLVAPASYAESLEDVIKILGPKKVAADFVQCGIFYSAIVNLAPEALGGQMAKEVETTGRAFLTGSLGILARYTDMSEKEGKEWFANLSYEYVDHHAIGLRENFDNHFDAWNIICEQYFPITDLLIQQGLVN